MRIEVTDDRIKVRAAAIRAADEAAAEAARDTEYRERARAELTSEAALGNTLVGPAAAVERERVAAREERDAMRQEARSLAAASGEKYEVVLRRLLKTAATGTSVAAASKMVAAASGRR